MSNLILRTITGIVFVVVIAGSLIWSPYPFAILFLAFALLGLREFYRMISRKNNHPHVFLGILSGLILYLSLAAYAFNMIPEELIMLNLLLVLIIFIAEIFSGVDNALNNVAYTILGLVYIVIPFALLNFFFLEDVQYGGYNPMLLLGFLILQWVYDIFAYLMGKFFGKTQLYAKVSPQKTWEGTIAGGFVTIAAAFAVNAFIFPLGWHHWPLVALIIVLFGTFGDLTESLLKRNFGVKDAGSIFPGHGGILDRFDGLLFTAPAVFIYFHLILNYAHT